MLRPLQSRSLTTHSRHAHWYSNILPSMIPIFLLGSAIYLGLELTQLKLAHQKYMVESTKQIQQLESEIASLREKRLGQTTPPPPSTRKRSWW